MSDPDDGTGWAVQIRFAGAGVGPTTVHEVEVEPVSGSLHCGSIV